MTELTKFSDGELRKELNKREKEVLKKAKV